MRAIEPLLQAAVERPIDLSRPFQAPARTTRGKRFLGEERGLDQKIYPFLEARNRYYVKVMSWLQANPSNPDLVEAIKSAYVWYEPKASGNVKLANSKQGHNDFLRAVVELKPNTIFLVGPRGSGKTFYLNYLMSTEIDNLYTRKKTMYRAELSKLFDYNAEHPNEPFTVEDYLYAHVAYVTYKYRERTPLWDEIWKDEGSVTTTMIRFASAAIGAGGTSRAVGVSPDQVVDQYKKLLETLAVIQLKDKSDKTFLFDILLNNFGRHFSFLLARTILQLTRIRGFSPILVFDGLDNVEYYRHRKLYNQLLDQIVILCLHHDDHRNLEGAKTVISLRNETYEHLKKLARRARFEIGTEKFVIKEHDIAAILTKRAGHTLQPPCAYFRSHKPDGAAYRTERESLAPQLRDSCPATADDFDRFFMIFANNYLSHLSKHAREVLGISAEVNPAQVMTFCYNWNLRRFIHNFVNVFRYTIFFKTRSTVADYRDYLLAEGLSLNGNLYLDSEEDDRSFGASIPNIFWFDQEINLTSWHGLTLYRILQSLNSEARLNKTGLLKALQSDFSYHKDIILQRFDICIKYGLIAGHYVPERGSLIYELTSKGRLFLRYPFLDINQFYIMALDTPLCSQAVRTSSMVFYHSNDPKFWTNYTEACVLTSTTLIRHILTTHKEEMRDLEASRNMFRLPESFPGVLIKGMVKHLSTLRHRNTGRFDDLVLTLKGLT